MKESRGLSYIKSEKMEKGPRYKRKRAIEIKESQNLIDGNKKGIEMTR